MLFTKSKMFLYTILIRTTQSGHKSLSVKTLNINQHIYNTKSESETNQREREREREKERERVKTKHFLEVTIIIG